MNTIMAWHWTMSWYIYIDIKNSELHILLFIYAKRRDREPAKSSAMNLKFGNVTICERFEFILCTYFYFSYIFSLPRAALCVSERKSNYFSFSLFVILQWKLCWKDIKDNISRCCCILYFVFVPPFRLSFFDAELLACCLCCLRDVGKIISAKEM